MYIDTISLLQKLMDLIGRYPVYGFDFVSRLVIYGKRRYVSTRVTISELNITLSLHLDYTRKIIERAR